MEFVIDKRTGEVNGKFDSEEGTYEGFNTRPGFFRYEVVRPAVTRREVVNVYRDGLGHVYGKDVEEVEVEPERGAWKLFYADDGKPVGYPIPAWKLADLEHFSKGDIVEEPVTVGYFVPFPPEKLAEVKAQREAEAAHEAAIQAMPERVDGIETVQDDIVLLLAEMIGA